MKFKNRRGFNVPYNQQGFIYFTCINYKYQPVEIRHKILNLCTKCGGQYYQAVFEAVTTEQNLLPIAMKHHMDETNLWRMVRKFFENWESCKWREG